MASKADPALLAPGPEAAGRVLRDPGLRAHIREVREAADAARARPVAPLPASGREDFLRTGDRLGFERPYFERRRSLVALGLASWLWRDREDLASLSRVIEAICAEERWALPAHDEDIELFACETAFALAEISACLEGTLAPETARRARAEVRGRVLDPFMGRGEWAWEGMRNNWCAVCASSIGAAAIYLEPDEARLGAILSRLGPTLARFLESFAEDGTCLEGLGYWTYGVGFYVAFAELLGRCSGGPSGGPSGAGRDLMEGAKFRRIAAFQSKAFLTDSISVAFADGSARERFRPGLAAFLSRRFPEAAVPTPALAARLADDECGRWCLSFRDLLWSAGYPAAEAGPGGTGPAEVGTAAERGRAAYTEGAPAPASADARAAPRPASWLPNAQWLVCPSAGPGTLGLAAKGGRNDEPHNHNDVGSFQLALGDAQFIAELGAGEYTRDYFGEGRYSIPCNSSLGHSVPIVGGLGQEAGAERRAREVSCRIEGRACRLEMDMAAAYENHEMRRLTRTFDFDGYALLVRDEYAFERGGPGPRRDGSGPGIVERFVTGVSASGIRIEAGRAVLEAEGSRLSLTCSIPGLAPRLVIIEHRAHDGSRVEVACLDYELPRGGASPAVEFEFRLARA